MRRTTTPGQASTIIRWGWSCPASARWTSTPATAPTRLTMWCRAMHRTSPRWSPVASPFSPLRASWWAPANASSWAYASSPAWASTHSSLYRRSLWTCILVPPRQVTPRSPTENSCLSTRGTCIFASASRKWCIKTSASTSRRAPAGASFTRPHADALPGWTSAPTAFDRANGRPFDWASRTDTTISPFWRPPTITP